MDEEENIGWRYTNYASDSEGDDEPIAVVYIKEEEGEEHQGPGQVAYVRRNVSNQVGRFNLRYGITYNTPLSPTRAQVRNIARLFNNLSIGEGPRYLDECPIIHYYRTTWGAGEIAFGAFWSRTRNSVIAQYSFRKRDVHKILELSISVPSLVRNRDFLGWSSSLVPRRRVNPRGWGDHEPQASRVAEYLNSVYGTEFPWGEVQGPPRTLYRYFLDLKEYILYTATERSKFVVNPIDLQILRLFSPRYSRFVSNTAKDFYVFISEFNQYIPGVILELLIRNCHFWEPPAIYYDLYQIISGNFDLNSYPKATDLLIKINILFETGFRKLKYPQHPAKFGRVNKRKLT